jgi:uncharacterized protein (DUF1778 family)
MAKTKTKPGPKPRDGETANHNVNVRLSPREYAALKAAAKDMGYRDNLSEFIRLVLFTAAAIVYKEEAHEANS